VSELELQPRDDDGRRLWESVADLVELLPSGWVLVGGLMVQLHALESGYDEVRATVDVDVLGQARPQGALDAIDSTLEAAGFTLERPDFDGYACRYVRDGLVVDVLAPDGIRPPPTLGDGRVAIGIPGGSQALARQESVAVRLGDRVFVVQRPTLLGAILIKARSLMVHHDPEAQREDLLLLLSLVEDPRRMADELRSSERRWLRDAAAKLEFDRSANIGAARVRLARLTHRLLMRES
jgi:hypothetical protein